MKRRREKRRKRKRGGGQKKRRRREEQDQRYRVEEEYAKEKNEIRYEDIRRRKKRVEEKEGEEKIIRFTRLSLCKTLIKYCIQKASIENSQTPLTLPQCCTYCVEDHHCTVYQVPSCNSTALQGKKESLLLRTHYGQNFKILSKNDEALFHCNDCNIIQCNNMFGIEFWVKLFSYSY